MTGDPSAGQAAYIAWRGNGTLPRMDGKAPPAWSELDWKEQAAWEEAAKAALRYHAGATVKGVWDFLRAEG